MQLQVVSIVNDIEFQYLISPRAVKVPTLAEFSQHQMSKSIETVIEHGFGVERHNDQLLYLIRP